MIFLLELVLYAYLWSGKASISITWLLRIMPYRCFGALILLQLFRSSFCHSYVSSESFIFKRLLRARFLEVNRCRQIVVITLTKALPAAFRGFHLGPKFPQLLIDWSFQRLKLPLNLVHVAVETLFHTFFHWEHGWFKIYFLVLIHQISGFQLIK